MGDPRISSSLGKDLHGAARIGDLNTVCSIISFNPLAINSRDKHSRTPLHLAAWSGQAQVVSYLCKHKADVGAAAIDNMGAIHFAAQKGHLEVVKTLFSLGVSVQASTRKGMTALHYAVQGCHSELVKYLVKKGASLSAKTKAGKTPLDLASSEGIRSFLTEFETSLMEEDGNGKEGADNSDPKLLLQETADSSIKEASVARHNNNDDEKLKRKVDEDTDGEASLESKKAKVALTHLLTVDDTHEEETHEVGADCVMPRKERAGMVRMEATVLPSGIRQL